MNLPEDNDEGQSSMSNDDLDSTLGDEEDYDDLQSTQSIASSVLNYTYENGRRYHAFRDGQYFMPNDDDEQQGMNLMHHVSLMILEGELYRAPVKDPLNILEIGTGTGFWAIDVADKFPAAHVIATDLSPIQPEWIPPNLEFQIDDCESRWCFRQKFDFIHMRNMSGSIAHWPNLLAQCFAQLRPGGWIEVSNIEAWAQSNTNFLTQETASYQWQHNLQRAASIFGRELNIAPEMERLLNEVGFVDVVDDKHYIPFSNWMPGKKELAKYFQTLAHLELESLSLRLYTGVLGWSPERLRALNDLVKRETKDPANQMYSTMHYVYGRKPMF